MWRRIKLLERRKKKFHPRENREPKGPQEEKKIIGKSTAGKKESGDPRRGKRDLGIIKEEEGNRRTSWMKQQ